MRSSGFFNIFAKSPIKPMQQHMEKVYSAIQELRQFFVAVIDGNWELALKSQNLILEFEAEADELKKEIRLQLPTSIFMAVDRVDLLGLLTNQDKIANKAKHIASIVYSRKMVLPKQIAQYYLKFVDRCIDAAKQAKRAINELDELIETGFKGREVKLVADMIVELDKLERDTDYMQVELRKRLFTAEKELNPIDVIFLYKIIDWAGDLADQAQHIGHRLESLLAS
jgi:predicted phosphate transport protein (TIGR00153 family)